MLCFKRFVGATKTWAKLQDKNNLMRKPESRGTQHHPRRWWGLHLSYLAIHSITCQVRTSLWAALWCGNMFKGVKDLVYTSGGPAEPRDARLKHSVAGTVKEGGGGPAWRSSPHIRWWAGSALPSPSWEYLFHVHVSATTLGLNVTKQDGQD